MFRYKLKEATGKVTIVEENEYNWTLNKYIKLDKNWFETPKIMKTNIQENEKSHLHRD